MAKHHSPHALAFIFVTVLIDTIGFGIIMPVTPQLIMDLTGQGIGEASLDGGWLAFAYAIAQFLCGPVIGNLSDHFGRRPVLLLSLLAFGCDYALMGFAPTLNWLFLGRVVAGIAGAAHTTANAYVADISSPEKRAQNFGMIGAAFGVGFILGPAIGGLLGGMGARAPFFAAAALAFVNLLYGFFVLPESLPADARRPFSWKRANTIGTVLQMRRYPVVFALAGALFLWQLAHQSLPNTWAYYTKFKFGWSEGEIGMSLAFAGVTMAIVQGGLTRVIIPRIGEHLAVLIGFTDGALGFLGYAFADRGWMLFVCLAGAALTGLAYPSLNAIMSKQIPRSSQGELQGAVASMYSLTAIIGPLLMTQLFGYFSTGRSGIVFPGAAFLCAALLTCGSIVLFLRATRLERESAAEPEGLEPIPEVSVE
jgi:DHA1 family tetracycline resistance protein-like MFS transporter